MAHGWLEFKAVTFRHVGAPAPLFSDLSFRLEAGFTGLFGANGAGKTTLLRLAAGELSPGSGRVDSSSPVFLCPQRADDPPVGLAEALSLPDRRTLALASRLGVDSDFPARWPTLSHGERKRAQVLLALRADPPLLLLDEPTNHIDRLARAQILGALEGYRGAALLVSHDRDFLDALCARCLFLEAGTVRIRPGGYTAAIAAIREEDERSRREWEARSREAKRLHREARRRREEADRTARGLTKRGLSPKDHDGRERVDRARLAGVDRAAARRARSLERRADRTAPADAKPPSTTGRRGIDLPGERSAREKLLARPAGEIPLGAGRRLRHPDLAVRPGDRIALTGPNGSGKSTLLDHLLESERLPAGRLLFVPQEVTAARARALLDEVRALPRQERGRILTAVARLGTDAERLLLTGEPSPGEVRKLAIARGLGGSPWVLVLDEPTNHLDLPSVELLEASLESCEAALLLVSHDFRFLSRLTTAWWEIDPAPGPRLAVRAGAVPEFPSTAPPV